MNKNMALLYHQRILGYLGIAHINNEPFFMSCIHSLGEKVIKNMSNSFIKKYHKKYGYNYFGWHVENNPRKIWRAFVRRGLD